jgi:hypothetical protein
MNDLELGPELRELIADARGAHEPTASVRAGVRWKVASKLTSGVTTLGERRRQQRVVLAVSVMVAAVTSAAAAVVVSEVTSAGAVAPAAAPITPPPATPPVYGRPPARAVPTESVSSSPTTAQTDEAAAPSLEAVPQASAPSRSERRGSGARRRSLAEETELIARANAAINRGDASGALQILQEYDRSHASGVLAEERSAALVFALCRAGRSAAARAEARRFEVRWPRSPHLARVRAACAGSGGGPSP